MPDRKLNTGHTPFGVNRGEWVASRFNVRSRGEDGALILYNSYTGAMGGVPQDKESEALEILGTGVTGELSELAQDLVAGGMLVHKGMNELNRP